jgi:hypothetical protein
VKARIGDVEEKDIDNFRRAVRRETAREIFDKLANTVVNYDGDASAETTANTFRTALTDFCRRTAPEYGVELTKKVKQG